MEILHTPMVRSCKYSNREKFYRTARYSIEQLGLESKGFCAVAGMTCVHAWRTNLVDLETFRALEYEMPTESYN